jgi:hypothetical protein
MEYAWRVERHGGASIHGWRTMFEGPEATAREVFGKIETSLRQGGVRLIRPDGHTEFIVNAPRLRTRW